MARIRTIKPDLWQDEAIAEVSERARLLFIGLITQADDEGRLKGSAKLIRSLIFPYDDITAPEVSGALEELSGAGLVVRYTVSGRPFIQLPTWEKHQRVSHRTDSALPSPSEADSADPPEDSGAAPEDSGAAVSGREGKGREGKQPVDEQKLADRGEVQQVFDTWIASTGKRKGSTKLTDERRRIIRKALKTYPVDDLIDAVRGWKHSPHHRGENDRQTVYNDIELLLRAAKQIEYFRDLERGASTAVDSWSDFLAVES